MIKTIDYKESLFLGKVIFKNDFLDTSSEKFVYFIFFLIYPLGSGAFFISLFRDEGFSMNTFLSLFVFIATLSFFLFLFVKWRKDFYFTCISGIDFDTNRKILSKILKENEWIFHENKWGNIKGGGNYLTVYKPKYLFSWGRELIIICDSSDIFVNVFSLLRHDLISPVHFVVNKKEIMNITNAFKKEIDDSRQ